MEMYLSSKPKVFPQIKNMNSNTDFITHTNEQQRNETKRIELTECEIDK